MKERIQRFWDLLKGLRGPPRGRVLEVKFGYNPNSSSIGADLTPLILFSGFLSLVVPPLMIYLRSRARKGEGKPLGSQEPS